MHRGPAATPRRHRYTAKLVEVLRRRSTVESRDTIDEERVVWTEPAIALSG